MSAPNDAQLRDLERVIQRASDAIVDDLDSEHIPLNNALAIIGCVAAKLLKRASPALRRDFIAALQGDAE